MACVSRSAAPISPPPSSAANVALSQKWLHSMHVKAFFEYLMGVSNDYWTNIPMDPSPIAQPVRDGIAMEDDMALRALLPHIRPKRGRKRPGNEDAANANTQRQRTAPDSAIDEYTPLAVWPHGGDARSTPMDNGPMSAVTGIWPPHETTQTPLTRWPASAITPSVQNGFWGDEPGSAVTPSKAKGPNQRRGAKNVSSAWKLAGDDGIKKTRGRPPVNRTPIDTPMTATTAWPPTPNPLQTPQDKSDANDYMGNGMLNSHASQDQDMAPPVSVHQVPQVQMSFPGQSQHTSTHPHKSTSHSHQDGARPSRPSISLQVPQRNGGVVRLATPPLAPHESSQRTPMRSEQWPGRSDHQEAIPSYVSTGPLPTYDNMHAPQPGQPYSEDKNGKTQKWEPAGAAGGSYSETSGENIPEYYFETMADRTNVDALMAYFARVTHESDWYDAEGRPTECASMEEASAIINSTLENMYRTATSMQAFLINLAALAGARMLMTNVTRCIRLGEREDHTAYRCEWEYRFGHLHGYFNMAATVPFTMWRARPQKREGSGGEDDESGSSAPNGGGVDDPEAPESSNPRLQAEHWQRKYKSLLGQVDKMDKELFELRNKVIDSLKK